MGERKRYTIKEPGDHSAFRLLITAAPDTDPIETCLAAAGRWSRPGPDAPVILVINATGRDLAAYARRHRFAVLEDDAGRPTRSLGEIVGALAQLDAAEVGAVVILDTNQIYRAARFALRDAEGIGNLSPGHWDTINEGLGAIGELVARAGIPAIFYAPPQDERGSDADGEEVVTGIKPHAWKDLERTAHASIHLTRSRSGSVDARVRVDDARGMGSPGAVIAGVDGDRIGRAYQLQAMGSHPTVGRTTTVENSAVELDARRRIDVRRADASARVRQRVVETAMLRVLQGAESWEDFSAWLASERHALTTGDEKIVDETIGGVMTSFGWAVEWSARATRDLEFRTDLREVARSIFDGQGRPYPVCGPCPRSAPCEAIGASRVERLLADPHALPSLIVGLAGDVLPAWIVGLARYAGLEGDVSFALASAAACVPDRGPAWQAYAAEELAQLALALAVQASASLAWDPRPPTDEQEVEALAPVVAIVPDIEDAPPPWPGPWPGDETEGELLASLKRLDAHPPFVEENVPESESEVIASRERAPPRLGAPGAETQDRGLA